MLKNISAIETFTINGESADYKTLASIGEVQIKKILRSNILMDSIRASATAEQIIDLGGLGTAIYRLPERVVFGTDYDVNNGVTRQRTGSLITELQMDQHLTIEVMFEDFDMSRFLESEPNVRASMLAAWLSSGMDSYLLSLEAIFLRGIEDYTIAQYKTRPSNILEIDPAKITNADLAKKVYLDINNLMLKLSKTFSNTAMGMDKRNFHLVISLELYTALVAYLPNFILNEWTFDRLASGNLYKDSLFGTQMLQHIMLNSKYDKGTGSQLNKDLSFDFTGLHVVLYIDSAIAQPLGWQQSEIIKDNVTLNPKWISKNLGSLPQIQRGDYVAIGLATLPTDEQVTAAQGKKYTGTKFDYSESFQLAKWDKEFTPVTMDKVIKKEQ